MASRALDPVGGTGALSYEICLTHAFVVNAMPRLLGPAGTGPRAVALCCLLALPATLATGWLAATLFTRPAARTTTAIHPHAALAERGIRTRHTHDPPTFRQSNAHLT